MPTPEQIKPYDSVRPKTEQVEEMFDSIAPAYDFMNRAMTLGIDKLWRAKAVKMIRRRQPADILDVATGTGDLAIKLAREIPGVRVTGVDLSERQGAPRGPERPHQPQQGRLPGVADGRRIVRRRHRGLRGAQF